MLLNARKGETKTWFLEELLENQLRLLTLTQMKQNISQVYQKLPSILGKLKFISYTTMEEFGRTKKLQ